MTRLALVLAQFLAWVPCTWAQSTQCFGSLPRNHPYGNFNFDTNSRVEPYTPPPFLAPSSQFRYQIVSCVSNADRDYDLWVRWFIPSFLGYVPPNNYKATTPRLRLDDVAQPLEGCLDRADVFKD